MVVFYLARVIIEFHNREIVIFIFNLLLAEQEKFGFPKKTQTMHAGYLREETFQNALRKNDYSTH